MNTPPLPTPPIVDSLLARADGRIEWLRNGVLHRDQGPALIEADGTIVFMREGKEHREDGPAVIRADGSHEFFLDGVRLGFEEFTRVATVRPEALPPSAFAPPGGIGKALRPLNAPRQPQAAPALAR